MGGLEFDGGWGRVVVVEGVLAGWLDGEGLLVGG